MRFKAMPIALLTVISPCLPAFAQSYRTASFQGGAPSGGPESELIYANGAFCGTTEGGGVSKAGTVFCATSGGQTILHTFTGSPDGAYPEAALLSVNGLFYGTTDEGGAHNDGIVFSLDPLTGAYTILHNFGSSAQDGMEPRAPLTQVGGTLYGTTYFGGATGKGCVFAMNLATGQFAITYSFGASTSDGQHPSAAALLFDGLLYGTTAYGGAPRRGTVFRLDPQTGAEAIVTDFAVSGAGTQPEAALIAANGLLYGTTALGGLEGEGTVFQVDPQTGAEKTVYNFDSVPNDGLEPVSGVIFSGGLLYGTTPAGGALYNGTAYSLDPVTGIETDLHDFGDGAADGHAPDARPLFHSGLLYGTTGAGGSAGEGTLFQLLP